jgi:hydrogenase-4 transcriptional activator
MILHRGEALRFDDLDATLPSMADARLPEDDGEVLDLDTVNRLHIQRVLRMTDGKIHGPGGAGELLGINPNTLRYRMRKLGVPFRRRTHGG